MTPEELFDANRKLVPWVAKKICPKDSSFWEDTLQDGEMGLWHACLRFDETKGNKFSSYASWCIRGYILRGHKNRRGNNPEYHDSLDEVVHQGADGREVTRQEFVPDSVDVEQQAVAAASLGRILDFFGGPHTLDSRCLMTCRTDIASFESIALEFGISPEAVRARQYRARKILRDRGLLAS